MKLSRIAAAVVSVISAMLVIVAPAHADPSAEAGIRAWAARCTNIGNGDLCISMNTYGSPQVADITVRFYKKTGSAVTVSFGYNSTAGYFGGPAGEVTIHPGQNRAYTWNYRSAPGGCYWPVLYHGFTTITGNCVNV